MVGNQVVQDVSVIRTTLQSHHRPNSKFRETNLHARHTLANYTSVGKRKVGKLNNYQCAIDTEGMSQVIS